MGYLGQAKQFKLAISLVVIAGFVGTTLPTFADHDPHHPPEDPLHIEGGAPPPPPPGNFAPPAGLPGGPGLPGANVLPGGIPGGPPIVGPPIAGAPGGIPGGPPPVGSDMKGPQMGHPGMAAGPEHIQPGQPGPHGPDHHGPEPVAGEMSPQGAKNPPAQPHTAGQAIPHNPALGHVTDLGDARLSGVDPNVVNMNAGPPSAGPNNPPQNFWEGQPSQPGQAGQPYTSNEFPQEVAPQGDGYFPDGLPKGPIQAGDNVMAGPFNGVSAGTAKQNGVSAGTAKQNGLWVDDTAAGIANQNPQNLDTSAPKIIDVGDLPDGIANQNPQNMSKVTPNSSGITNVGNNAGTSIQSNHNTPGLGLKSETGYDILSAKTSQQGSAPKDDIAVDSTSEGITDGLPNTPGILTDGQPYGVNGPEGLPLKSETGYDINSKVQDQPTINRFDDIMPDEAIKSQQPMNNTRPNTSSVYSSNGGDDIAPQQPQASNFEMKDHHYLQKGKTSEAKNTLQQSSQNGIAVDSTGVGVQGSQVKLNISDWSDPDGNNPLRMEGNTPETKNVLQTDTMDQYGRPIAGTINLKPYSKKGIAVDTTAAGVQAEGQPTVNRFEDIMPDVAVKSKETVNPDLSYNEDGIPYYYGNKEIQGQQSQLSTDDITNAGGYLSKESSANGFEINDDDINIKPKNNIWDGLEEAGI